MKYNARTTSGEPKLRCASKFDKFPRETVDVTSCLVTTVSGDSLRRRDGGELISSCLHRPASFGDNEEQHGLVSAWPDLTR